MMTFFLIMKTQLSLKIYLHWKYRWHNNIRSHVVSLSKYNGEYILYDAQNKKYLSD